MYSRVRIRVRPRHLHLIRLLSRITSLRVDSRENNQADLHGEPWKNQGRFQVKGPDLGRFLSTGNMTLLFE